MQENQFEDELLVKVPGSAYTIGNNTGNRSEESTRSKEVPASTNEEHV